MTTLALAPRGATWTERGSTSAIFLALGIATGAWAAALPALKATLALSDRDLSFVLLAVAVSSVLATLIAGVLTPRIGTGPATIGAAVALVLAVTLPGLSGTMVTLIMAGVGFGVTMGFLDVAMNGHASDVERRWGQAIMSSFHGAFSLGGLLGAVLGGFLATRGLGTLGQLAIPAVVVAGLVLGAAVGLGPGVRGESHELGVAWPVRAAWSLGAAALFCLVIEGAMADWSAVYLATVVHASEGAAASGYAAFSVTMTIGRLAGDQVVRRLGSRVVVIGGGVVAGLGLAASVAFPALVPASLGFALVGLGLSNVAPTLFSAAGHLGRSPSAGVAMVVSLGYIGFISGPPIIGAVASVFDLRVALGCLVAVSAGLVASGSRMRRASA